MKAKQLIPLLDLSANPGDDEAAILRLCKQAVTPFGRVAALRVPPSQVALARQTLNEHHGKSIAVATLLANEGEALDYAELLSRASQALQQGAQELEWHGGHEGERLQQHFIALQALCLPYQALLKIQWPQDESLRPQALLWARQQQLAFISMDVQDALAALPQFDFTAGLGLKIQADKPGSKWLGCLNSLAKQEALLNVSNFRLGCSPALLHELLHELGAAGAAP